MNDRELLVRLFRAGLAATHAGDAVERALRALPSEALGRAAPLCVLGAGKAACAMALGVTRALGTRITSGELTTRDGHGTPIPGLSVREAAHPLPDARSVAAAESALARAAALSAEQALLVLLSGGASALWCAPAPGISLADKQRVTELLLRCGAAIDEVNTVRRHLSRIKGGGLARAAAARPLLTLAVSDVAGDLPHAIGSGPTVADPTRRADALRVLAGYGLLTRVPASVRARLEAADGEAERRTASREPPQLHVIASLAHAIEAVLHDARSLGLRARSLGPMLYGDVAALVRELADALSHARHDGVELLVAGGEPTVRVTGDGRGGRCQELALRFAFELAAVPGVTALFAGTDGSDGPTAAAGAFCDGATLARARERGRDPRASLARNDSHTLLGELGDLLVTGPTQTNVNDLALLRIRG